LMVMLLEDVRLLEDATEDDAVRCRVVYFHGLLACILFSKILIIIISHFIEETL
jgi:hypothetical protein